MAGKSLQSGVSILPRNRRAAGVAESSEWLLDAFRDDEDFTDEDVEYIEEIFGLDEDTNIRWFYKRR